MSAAYLPVVEPLTAAGCHVTARILLKGSPVSVAASIYAARPHEIARDWFRNVSTGTGATFGVQAKRSTPP
jgi:hypothetical protein